MVDLLIVFFVSVFTGAFASQLVPSGARIIIALVSASGGSICFAGWRASTAKPLIPLTACCFIGTGLFLSAAFSHAGRFNVLDARLCAFGFARAIVLSGGSTLQVVTVVAMPLSDGGLGQLCHG